MKKPLRIIYRGSRDMEISNFIFYSLQDVIEWIRRLPEDEHLLKIKKDAEKYFQEVK
jgi:hypothetical protein